MKVQLIYAIDEKGCFVEIVDQAQNVWMEHWDREFLEEFLATACSSGLLTVDTLAPRGRELRGLA